MKYNILCQVDANRVYYLREYPSGRQFTWSESTFLNHYYDGESFYRFEQVAKQHEIDRNAVRETIKWNNDFGCWQYIVKADVKPIYNNRQKYVFVRESRYNGQAEYFVRKGVNSYNMLDAKIFDESDVYAQMKVLEKMKSGFRVIRVQ